MELLDFKLLFEKKNGESINLIEESFRRYRIIGSDEVLKRTFMKLVGE